jgi:hypothetical protein
MGKHLSRGFKHGVLGVAAMIVCSCGQASSGSSQGPIPSVIITALGYQSLLLSAGGALYMSPAAGAPSTSGTYDYHIAALSGSVYPTNFGDNPIIQSRIAGALICSWLATSGVPRVDMIDFLFDAGSSTGTAHVTSQQSAAAPLSVQATATTTSSSSPTGPGAVSVQREDHSACFGAALEGASHAQAFCDCYYGAGTPASAQCVPLRQGSEAWLSQSTLSTPDAGSTSPTGLVSCSAPAPVDPVNCSLGYFCCQSANCWECNGNTASDQSFAQGYCRYSVVEHCN